MKSKEIIRLLEDIAPKKLAESWDNVGIQLGGFNKNINKLMLALEINIDVVDEAIKEKVDMIITHHPMFFTEIKNINPETTKGEMIYKLINNNITVYSAHTNLDASNMGVNDELTRLLDIKDTKILDKVYEEKLYRIIVQVPKSHEDKVRNAISNAGGGYIGNYSHCTFNTEGYGTFMPREGADPYIGKLGELEKVEEVSIETVSTEENLDKIIYEMKKAHPYEEVSYSVYKLINNNNVYGIGRVGNIEEMTLKDFSKKVKDKLQCNEVRIYGDLNKEIKKVAISGGSGSDFIKNAARENVDVYVTSDIKHHDAQEAKELGLDIIDAGHFYTEKIIMKRLKEYFKGNCNADIEIVISKEDNSSHYTSI